MLADNNYCNKVNAEYEAIKNTVLKRVDLNQILTTSAQSDNNSTSSIPPCRKANASALTTSFYDNLEQQKQQDYHVSIPNIDMAQEDKTEPFVYTIEDLIADEEAANTSFEEKSGMFNQMLKEVERATSQAEQLERLDEVEVGVSWSLVDDIRANATPALKRHHSVELNFQPHINANIVEIEDVFSAKPRDQDTSRIDVDCIPFYQVSEALIIEESYTFKKDTQGTQQDT